VQWLPFDLHPEYPPEGIPRSELERRYPEDSRARTQGMIEAAGIAYNPPPDVVPNSRKALEVTELARDRGVHHDVHDRLMHAYWSEAANIGDEEMLLDLVTEAGLDRAEAAETIADRRYRERVDASTFEANRHGINAIPAFVLGNHLLLLGAQPEGVFEQAVAQLEKEE
jgi:predicted DsbA family dithiol-disulfide isomerase